MLLSCQRDILLSSWVRLRVSHLRGLEPIPYPWPSACETRSRTDDLTSSDGWSGIESLIPFPSERGLRDLLRVCLSLITNRSFEILDLFELEDESSHDTEADLHVVIV